ADEQYVALLDAHALSRLGALEFVGRDALAGLEPVHAAQARHVEQHAAAHDAIGDHHHAAASSASAAHLAHREAVVDPTIHGDVTERVEMRGRHAVEGDADEVHRRADSGHHRL